MSLSGWFRRWFEPPKPPRRRQKRKGRDPGEATALSMAEPERPTLGMGLPLTELDILQGTAYWTGLLISESTWDEIRVDGYRRQPLFLRLSPTTGNLVQVGVVVFGPFQVPVKITHYVIFKIRQNTGIGKIYGIYPLGAVHTIPPGERCFFNNIVLDV